MVVADFEMLPHWLFFEVFVSPQFYLSLPKWYKKIIKLSMYDAQFGISLTYHYQSIKLITKSDGREIARMCRN